MKTIDSLFRDIQHFFAVEKGYIVFFFAALTTVDALVLALTHQMTGFLPSVENLQLFWWHWEIPFSISRLWDLLVGPLCIALFLFLSRQDCFYEAGNHGAVSLFGLLVTVALLGSCTVVVYFGVMYAPVVPAAIAMVWACWVLLVELDDVSSQR